MQVFIWHNNAVTSPTVAVSMNADLSVWLTTSPLHVSAYPPRSNITHHDHGKDGPRRDEIRTDTQSDNLQRQSDSLPKVSLQPLLPSSQGESHHLRPDCQSA